jgi:protein-L-isoaspartate(D-aspartate) O-methyltransferase
MIFTDSYRHQGLRQRLVLDLQKRGIENEAVLEAIATIPRHFFLEKAFEEWAYEDKAFPIGNDQTISQPYTVAYMTDLLNLKLGDKVLEIGTGSGYQSAILAVMGANVYTIERQEALYSHATSLLQRIGFPQIHTFFGDGHEGLIKNAPFNKIIVTAGAAEVPKKLLAQLALDGCMVIPVGDKKRQVMQRITRSFYEDYTVEAFENFKFVPFLKGVHKM